jgi:hypothetical protein
MVSWHNLILSLLTSLGEHILCLNLIHGDQHPNNGSGDGDDDEDRNMRLEGAVRAFEDGLLAESIYRRDWRETRLDAYRDGRADQGVSSMTLTGKGGGGGGSALDVAGVLHDRPITSHRV